LIVLEAERLNIVPASLYISTMAIGMVFRDAGTQLNDIINTDTAFSALVPTPSPHATQTITESVESGTLLKCSK
jgi:hypothetical protein